MNPNTIMMSFNDINYEDFIFNSFVKIPDEVLTVKCSCCNIISTDYEEHMKSDHHRRQICAYVTLGSKFDNVAVLKDYFKKIVDEYIAISLPSFLKSTSVNNFHSYCYKCLKFLKNGANGIKQHLQNGHRCLPQGNSLCHDCCVKLANLQNHIKLSDFHEFVVKDLIDYGIELSELFYFDQGRILDVPNSWNDIKEYRKVFLTLMVNEMKKQRALARESRIDKIRIVWKLEENWKPAVGSFKLSPSDDQYFKIKLADELVIYLDKEGWSMRSTVTAMPYDFKSEDVCIRLVNNTGLKPEIEEDYSITQRFSLTVFWRLRVALNQSLVLPSPLNKILLNKTVSEKDYNSSSDICPVTKTKINCNVNVNESQMKAIELALDKKFLMIHGPPGTGKTDTCALIVANLAMMDKDKKILICAPSNKAVDILTEKLHFHMIDVVRVFSKKAEDLNSSVKHLSLTRLALEIDSSLSMDYDKFVNKTLPAKKYANYMRKFESAKRTVLTTKMVTCTTLVTAASEEIESNEYDFLVVDEAGQALEPENLIPIALFKPSKVILVGDHKQLPPLVLSKNANKAGFGISMFERLMGNATIPKIMLRYQYRMNPLIASFSNTQFYNGELKNGITDDDRTWPLSLFKFNDKALIFINVTGEEKVFGKSLYNEREGKQIVKLLEYLINEEDIDPDKIGVITFYEGQNVFLHNLVNGSSKLSKRVEIANVDAFQGKEKCLIILSLVRSNIDGDIGFLENENRLNVALTRAKFKLIIFGNRTTFKMNPLYKPLFKHIDEHCASYEDDVLFSE